MTVADNGKGGVQQNADSDRLGLIGMQERVELLGGSFRIISGESGTMLEATVPLDQAT
jgi:signal transduction histidine kinase